MNFLIYIVSIVAGVSPYQRGIVNVSHKSRGYTCLLNIYVYFIEGQTRALMNNEIFIFFLILTF